MPSLRQPLTSNIAVGLAPVPMFLLILTLALALLLKDVGTLVSRWSRSTIRRAASAPDRPPAARRHDPAAPSNPPSRPGRRGPSSVR